MHNSSFERRDCLPPSPAVSPTHDMWACGRENNLTALPHPESSKKLGTVELQREKRRVRLLIFEREDSLPPSPAVSTTHDMWVCGGENNLTAFPHPESSKKLGTGELQREKRRVKLLILKIKDYLPPSPAVSTTHDMWVSGGENDLTAFPHPRVEQKVGDGGVTE